MIDQNGIWYGAAPMGQGNLAALLRAYGQNRGAMPSAAGATTQPGTQPGTTPFMQYGQRRGMMPSQAQGMPFQGRQMGYGNLRGFGPPGAQWYGSQAQGAGTPYAPMQAQQNVQQAPQRAVNPVDPTMAANPYVQKFQDLYKQDPTQAYAFWNANPGLQHGAAGQAALTGVFGGDVVDPNSQAGLAKRNWVNNADYSGFRNQDWYAQARGYDPNTGQATGNLFGMKMGWAG